MQCFQQVLPCFYVFVPRKRTGRKTGLVRCPIFFVFDPEYATLYNTANRWVPIPSAAPKRAVCPIDSYVHVSSFMQLETRSFPARFLTLMVFCIWFHISLGAPYNTAVYGTLMYYNS